MVKFKTFIDDNEVKDIDPIMFDVMDETVGPLIVASYAVAPSPPAPNPGIPVAAAAAMIAKTKAVDAAGFALLIGLLMADVASLIYSKLAAGSASLATPAAVGTAGGPIAPAALAGPPVKGPNADRFAKAALQWAVALIPPGDLRLLSPLTV
jgi:hypothetical protein